MKTLLEVVQVTTAFFQKKGLESPRLNAEHLIAHALGKKRLDLYLEFDRPLAETDLGPMREMVRRRADGVPLQHLLGTVEFCGREFRCDARALVPRPETELLVEHAQSAVREPKSRILDVGTGSGVIALSLAAELPEAKVDAVDISEEALALARENAASLGLTERVRFWQSDLFSSVADRYDLIVANLPYVAASVIPTLSREVQGDPRTALDGGELGHELIARLVAEAPTRLNPNGLVLVEMGHDQAGRLAAEFASRGYHEVQALPDLQGVTRFLRASVR